MQRNTKALSDANAMIAIQTKRAALAPLRAWIARVISCIQPLSIGRSCGSAGRYRRHVKAWPMTREGLANDLCDRRSGVHACSPMPGERSSRPDNGPGAAKFHSIGKFTVVGRE